MNNLSIDFNNITKKDLEWSVMELSKLLEEFVKPEKTKYQLIKLSWKENTKCF